MTCRAIYSKSLRVYAVLFAVGLLLAGCASAPEAAPGAPVSCRLLPKTEIWTYGPDSNVNPFLAPGALLRGAPDEFVVLQLDLSLPESARIGLAGFVRDFSEKIVARLIDHKELGDYWSNWGDASDRSSRQRLSTLERWYVPSLEFVAHPGRSRYIIVLMGKNPIPRPAPVVVTVSVNAVEMEPFTFPLPEAKK